MKMNKKQVVLIAGLVCVVLLGLLLTIGGKETPAAPVETETAAQATEVVATEETEAVTEETTEATEESTEATEEATEPTEEETKPTTGNTTPGGTGGYNPGYNPGYGDNNTNNQPETETTPAAGSEESPYLDIVTQLPDSIQTVAIAKDTTVHHTILGAAGAVLTIDDADAYVIYDEVTYNPDEFGVIQVTLAAAETEDTSVVLAVGSKSEEEKAYTLHFQPPVGAQSNPEVIEPEEDILTLEVILAEGDKDGYFYQYTAAKNSVLSFWVEEITEEVQCQIIVTLGEVVTQSEDGMVSVEMKQDEVALIQVIAVPDEEETYPAAQIKIMGMLQDEPGSSTNPIVVGGEFPIVTKEIEPGASVFYDVYGAGEMTLTVEDPDVCLTIDGVTFVPVNGKISTAITTSNPRMPVSIVVGNSGEQAKSFTLNFVAPIGSEMNPDKLVAGENVAALQEGDTDGYWFTWTAESAGVITITMPENDWMYHVDYTSNEETFYGDIQWSDSDPVVDTWEMEVAAGDVVNVNVSTYDPENPYGAPAGELTFTMSFVQHVEVTFLGAEITLNPGETAFCKALIRAESIILNAEGQGDFAITMDGRNYAAVNGKVVIESVKSDFYAPKEFTITNHSDSAATYTLYYENPVGSSENPAQIVEMGAYSCQVSGDGQGYFFQWIATEDGQFTIALQGDDWAYVMHNLTSYVYGDNRLSTNGDPAEQTITVKAGDEIQINLGTASREEKTVSFTASFVAAQEPGDEENGEDATTGDDVPSDDVTSTVEDVLPDADTVTGEENATGGDITDAADSTESTEASQETTEVTEGEITE